MASRLARKRKTPGAQAAVEYLLLLAAVTGVVLYAFKTLLPQNREAAEGYVNMVARGIYGAPAIYTSPAGNMVDRARQGAANYP